MKRALFLYWHGLGDVIMLSPLLRELYNRGYKTDLICRKSVETSSLLESCPYTDKLIIVENPWRSKIGFAKQANANVNLLKEMSPDYDWSGGAIHSGRFGDKIKRNFQEGKLSTKDYRLEVFIPDDIRKEVGRYVQERYPQGFIFNHTMIEFHTNHDWNSRKWIKENLPNLPVVDTGTQGDYYMKWQDIRYTFALLKNAKHRVLSSSASVFMGDFC